SSAGKKDKKKEEEEKKKVEDEKKDSTEAGANVTETSAAAAIAAVLAAAAQADVSPSDFTFSPAVGHLPPYSTKAITVTFKSSLPRAYVQTSAVCQ
ncbi:hypothetical protein, partial [Citrobacter braakii]|uniref:hypothetical protein n=1 Tax=Citrobacter braakii TaxID=57706 RepID=UPI0019816C2A